MQNEENLICELKQVPATRKDFLFLYLMLQLPTFICGAALLVAAPLLEAWIYSGVMDTVNTIFSIALWVVLGLLAVMMVFSYLVLPLRSYRIAHSYRSQRKLYQDRLFIHMEPKEGIQGHPSELTFRFDGTTKVKAFKNYFGIFSIYNRRKVATLAKYEELNEEGIAFLQNLAKK